MFFSFFPFFFQALLLALLLITITIDQSRVLKTLPMTEERKMMIIKRIDKSFFSNLALSKLIKIKLC